MRIGFNQKVRLDSDRGVSLRDLRVGALCYSVTQRFYSWECEISRLVADVNKKPREAIRLEAEKFTDFQTP